VSRSSRARQKEQHVQASASTKVVCKYCIKRQHCDLEEREKCLQLGHCTHHSPLHLVGKATARCTEEPWTRILLGLQYCYSERTVSQRQVPANPKDKPHLHCRPWLVPAPRPCCGGMRWRRWLLACLLPPAPGTLPSVPGPWHHSGAPRSVGRHAHARGEQGEHSESLCGMCVCMAGGGGGGGGEGGGCLCVGVLSQ